MVWFFLYNTIKFGFKIKPYKQCIANKFIVEHQRTIRWYVSDNKVSHMDDSVNSMIA